MNGTEKIVKHLEMIQAVINRLGNNSFLLKSWSMTVIVAAAVLTRILHERSGQNPCKPL